MLLELRFVQYFGGFNHPALVPDVSNYLIRTMKNKNILLLLLLGLSISASAQTSGSPAFGNKKDIVKIDLLALPLKNISVQYERVLSKRISVALGGRLMPETSLPFKSLLINQVAGTDQDTKDIINNARLSNFAVTPEVRFYLGKGYGKGFYIAPYYRYVRFATNTVTVNYAEPTGPQRSLSLSGDLSANTGGLMFGAQWFLGKNITLDWWILGAHYGSGTGNFNGVPSTPLTPGEQSDVKQTLEDLDIPLVDKTVNVTANKVQVAFSGPFGGLRSGLSLGIRF